MITAGSRPRLAGKARLRVDPRSGKHMLLYPVRPLLPLFVRCFGLCLCSCLHWQCAALDCVYDHHSAHRVYAVYGVDGAHGSVRRCDIYVSSALVPSHCSAC